MSNFYTAPKVNLNRCKGNSYTQVIYTFAMNSKIALNWWDCFGMRKFKKLMREPGVFLRDYFNKRYPVTNCELKIPEDLESQIIEFQKSQLKFERKINSFDCMDVDIVFTWVNDKDQCWLSKKDHYIKENQKTVENDISVNNARFENHNELFYSVHSVKIFLPWVRKIFIVTDAQVPEWLDKDDDQIILVDHSDIIDAQYLPTFNSHVIEANLHKINGLSENFIYFNDDVFVARPLYKEHFFKNNEIASLFLAKKSLSEMLNKGVKTPTLTASKNSIDLLKKDYNSLIDFPLIHTYIPLKKSTYESIWKKYDTHIKKFLNNKFRSPSDLNLASFLVPWVMYFEGKSVIAQDICYYFNIRSPHALTQYQKLIERQKEGQQPHSFCANDFISDVDQLHDYHHKLERLLKQYYL